MDSETTPQPSDHMDPSKPSRPVKGDGGHDESAGITPVEPMTPSLLGRLFAVPFLIIGAIVGGAVLIVVLFGGTTPGDERSVAELVRVLESSSGEKSLGILLPREKELWQTALELSLRLKEKDKEAALTEEELQSVADRIGGLVRTDLANLNRLPTVGVERSNQKQVRSKRLDFLIHALGRTGRPSAVETLIEIVESKREPHVQAAMQELGDLHTLPQTRRAIEPIVALLDRSASLETRLVACTVLSVLATPRDTNVINALKAVRLVGNEEETWSAALALARLNSDAGKSTLLDLLDRSYLESGKRYHVEDESGRVHRYPFPPQRVENLLVAAIDAAAHLHDPDLWDGMELLKSDSSPVVRNRATEALQARLGARDEGVDGG